MGKTTIPASNYALNLGARLGNMSVYHQSNSKVLHHSSVKKVARSNEDRS